MKPRFFLHSPQRSAWRVAAFLLSILCVLGRSNGLAANPDGALRTEVIAAYNLVVDSNVESPSTYAPRAAYLGAKFYNDGAVPLTNVFAYIGDYVDGVNDTPGIYPRRTHMSLVGFPPDGKFALTHEGGSSGTADATRYIGTILPGESVTVYWLISYPNLDADGHAVHGPSVKPDDDLWLEYDIWAKGFQSGTPRTSVVPRTITMRNEISAMANKIYPNGANKVPNQYLDLLGIYAPQWTNVQVAAIAPGTITALQGYWYDLGNVGHGFDNDGDFVPDKNAWMQPVGDPSLIDPSCFRLVRTYAMVIVKLKDGGEHVITAENQLYFEHVPENTGAVGFIGYEYMALNGPCVARFTPYQEVASGFDNEKFNGDYGAPLPPLYSSEPEVGITKDASVATVAVGGTIQYTINYTNSGTAAVGVPELGVPLVVQDSIPSGTRYVAGSASSANVLPSGVTNYTILYSTNNGTNWSYTEPAAATNVTDIQWWLSNPLETNQAGIVRFSVTVKNPYTNASPLIDNVAGLSFGNNAPFATDDAHTLVLGNNILLGTVYSDTGSGGNFGNANLDVGEPKIQNVTLSLYSDLNGDGEADSGDVFLFSSNSLANGTYSFSNLFDGKYVVVVDVMDTDVPFGYTITTVDHRGADLDSAKVNANPVISFNNDFGFAPAFILEKQIVGSTNLTEGSFVTNTIDLINLLPGDGSSIGIPATYFAWNLESGTAQNQSKAWINPQNATNAPDGLSAEAPFLSAGDELSTASFPYPPQLGTITKVELIMVARTNVAFERASSMTIEVHTNGTQIFSTNLVVSNFFKSGTLTNFYITVASNLPWSAFSGNTISNRFLATKSGSDPGRMELDAVGFRITTDQIVGEGTASTTLDPVPLVDTYNTNLLRFISASPSPDGESGNMLTWDNVGPIYPGGTNRVTLKFQVLQPPGNVGLSSLINTAAVFTATYGNGRPANPATSMVSAAISPAGSIGDFVWRDVNSNGVFDVGTELGIPYVSVVLSNRTTLANVTNVTDSTGYYLFSGITNSATYDVKVLTNTLPPNFVQTYDRDGIVTANTAAIASFNPAATDGSDTITNADFGYRFTTALIEGYVWNDLNRSGTTTADLGEPALTNTRVVLYLSGTPVRTNSTDLNGYFKFTNLNSGTYTIVVTNTTGVLTNAGWVQSFDSDGVPTSTNSVSVTVPFGGSGRGDFSYYQTGSLTIGDTLFYDWDGDAVQDPLDEGIANITVWLYVDRNTNGVVDAGTDVLTLTTSTDANGQYLFTNLATNAYIVLVNETDPQFPTHVNQTKDPDSTLDGKSSLVLTASNLNQDFGYQPYGTGTIGDTVWFDVDADGIEEAGEPGLANITVTLQADFNGDGTYVSMATNQTDASGLYIFSNLPGGNYRVIVDANDDDLPDDAFENSYVPTTVTTRSVTLADAGSNLTADFGFTALGAIGDTIFWDANGNGTQDWNEIGVSNVTVNLYYDANANRVYDDGETLAGSDVTSTNGTYLFTALSASNYVVVVVTNSGPLVGVSLTADPNADGEPCNGTCDGQYGLNLSVGMSFMGADFGYQPPGVIGDLVWLDTDDDGVFDAGEVGIPFITVELRDSGNNLVATNVTDPDGFYLFSNVTNGNYKVIVLTSDPDFPAGLAATYDADGIGTANQSSLTIANGESNLDQDFGYRYVGGNVLSGTVGLDATPFDGVMGTNNSGVNVDEAPFADVSVALYRWVDNGNSIIESGETDLISFTTTIVNGDYSFTGLPSGGVSNYFVVSLSSPYDNLFLTTTNGSTPSVRVVNTTNAFGESLSAYQVVTNQTVSTNIDFAYTSSVNYDYGDLPESYATSLQFDGPRHIVAGSPNLYLGASVDTEGNGVPTFDASGDGADENGVTASGVWRIGANSGSVSVTVGAGSGWLVGWVDFDQDGSFNEVGDMIVNQAVSSGTFTVNFDIPNGAEISTTSTTSFYTRFRLFSEQPLFPELAHSGEADNGEVEDHLMTLGAIGDLVWTDHDGDGVKDPTEPPIAGARVFIDLNGDFQYQVNEPSSITTGSGIWNIGGLGAGTYSVVVDTTTLAGGLEVTGDPDVTKDGRTSAILAAGQVRSDLDFGYRPMVPTLALLASIRGYVNDGVATIEWRTASEVGTLAYDLYRQTASGGWELVNDQLVLALNSITGGTYSVEDSGAEIPGTHVYKLVEWEEDGDEIVVGIYTLSFSESLNITATRQGDQIKLQWQGGNPPYHLEKRSSLGSSTGSSVLPMPAWIEVPLPDPKATSILIPLDGTSEFYRVRSGP